MKVSLAAVVAIALLPTSGHAQHLGGDSSGMYAGRPITEWAQEALQDTTIKVRSKALMALSRMRSVGAQLAPIFEKAAEVGPPASRIRALAALSALGTAAGAAAQVLTTALADQNPEVRMAALEAVQGVGPAASAALPRLQGLLASGELDPAMQEAGLYALAAIDSAAAAPFAIAALQSANRDVRWAALEVLANSSVNADSVLAAVVPLIRGGDAELAVAAATTALAVLRAPPPTVRQMMAEVLPGGAVAGDGRPYVSGVDGAWVVRQVGLNLFMKRCPETCNTQILQLPFGGPDVRRLSVDLSSPASRAEPLGIISDAEAAIRVFYHRPPSGRARWIHEMPLADTPQAVERVQVEFRVAGRPHILQFGSWGQGHVNPLAPLIHGDGTTTPLVLHDTPRQWTVRIPRGGTGRLWDISDPDAPLDRGLYVVPLEVRFADIGG